MSVEIIRTTEGQADLAGILTYFLDANEPILAGRFLDGYEQTLRMIADFPELGSPWESSRKRLKDLRVKLVVGFENHLVVYRVASTGIYVLRVLHGHRDIENIL
jgi:toxin ParE1/3/4